MKKLLSAIMLVTMLSLTMALSALAAPGNGARVTNQDVNYTDCSSSFGYTACFSAVGTIHNTVTPSGNDSYTVNVVECSSFTEDATGTVVDQGCYTVKSHSLTQDGVLQELGTHLSGSDTYLGQTCTLTEAIHYANGQFQFTRVSSSCQ